MTNRDAATPICNLVADAYRKASGADFGFTVSGMVRSGLIKGISGVQTVTDVFGLDPLGNGVLDQTAGAGLVVGYITGHELKNLFEYFIVDNPVHPGEYWARPSGFRFYYDRNRPKFDQVVKVEVGDIRNGYTEIDISGKEERLYGIATNRYLALYLTGISEFREGPLKIVFKNKSGNPISTSAEALVSSRSSSPYIGHLGGTTDPSSIVSDSGESGFKEIKTWQAVMDYISFIPVKDENGITVLKKDSAATEVRGIDITEK